MKKKIILFILAYFRFFSKLQLLKNSPFIIGVTGSAGKTSLRDAIVAILKEERKIKANYKANSQTGIPLNILGLSPKNFSLLDWLRLIVLSPIKLITNWEKYDTYIVEMGIDSPLPPKNMDELLKIVKPNIGVLLNVAATHSEPFDFLIKTNNPQQRYEEVIGLIAKEKGKIVTELNSSDIAIINADQKEITNLEKNIKAKTTLFGKDEKSDVRFSSYSISDRGTNFTIKYQDEIENITFDNQVLAKHFGLTFAASIAVGINMGISFKKSCQLLKKNYKLPPGRSSLIRGINDTLIIDSSYNSSKQPTLNMLDLLTNIDSKRKITVLGDMRELGQIAKLEHEEVIKKAIQTSNIIVLVGPLMKKFAYPIAKQSSIPTYWYKNAYQVANFLKKELQPKDLVLIKGSQNTLLLEIVVEEIMRDKLKANKLLARRGKYWDKRREEIKNLI